jgi:hypothetical protein
MGLLTLIPGPYRIIAMALAAVALFGFGFLKGMQWEQGKQAVDQAEAYQEMIVRIQKKAAEDRKAADKFAKEKADERKKSKLIKQQLDDLLSDPRYGAKECDVDSDVVDKINEALK